MRLVSSFRDMWISLTLSFAALALGTEVSAAEHYVSCEDIGLNVPFGKDNVFPSLRMWTHGIQVKS